MIIGEGPGQHAVIGRLALHGLILPVQADAQAQRELLRLRIIHIHSQPVRLGPVRVPDPARKPPQQHAASAFGHADHKPVLRLLQDLRANGNRVAQGNRLFPKPCAVRNK